MTAREKAGATASTESTESMLDLQESRELMQIEQALKDLARILKDPDRNQPFLRAVRETTRATISAFEEEGPYATTIGELKILAHLQVESRPETLKSVRQHVITASRGLNKAGISSREASQLAKFFEMYAQAKNLHQHGYLHRWEEMLGGSSSAPASPGQEVHGS